MLIPVQKEVECIGDEEGNEALDADVGKRRNSVHGHLAASVVDCPKNKSLGRERVENARPEAIPDLLLRRFVWVLPVWVRSEENVKEMVSQYLRVWLIGYLASARQALSPTQLKEALSLPPILPRSSVVVPTSIGLGTRTCLPPGRTGIAGRM